MPHVAWFAEDLLGDGRLDAIHPDDRERVERAWREAVAARALFEAEYRVVGPDGVRWLEVCGVPVPEGEGAGWLGTSRDVTDRRALEERLTEERATLEAVLDQAPAAIAIVWGRNHVFRFYNESYLALVPEGRLARGRAIRDALPEAGVAWDALDRAYVGEEVRVHDLPVPFADERSFEGERFYDVVFTPVLRDGAPAGVLILAQETTEQVRERRTLEAQLRRERELAERFQHALLPDRLPDVPGLDLAVRYYPAGPDVGVGGDWYDVVVVDPARALLVVGDVCGRGLGAATTMAQVRAALRAYAVEDPSPVSVLQRLSVFTECLGLSVVTVGLCLLDLETGDLVYSSGGHPPPVMCRPDGDPQYLDVVGGPLIGLNPGVYREVRDRLDPGGFIAMYTDGLVEERGRSLESTFAELRGAVQCDAPTADRACDGLIDARIDRDAAHDDVALLVCHFRGPAATAFAGPRLAQAS